MAESDTGGIVDRLATCFFESGKKKLSLKVVVEGTKWNKSAEMGAVVLVVLFEYFHTVFSYCML